MRNTSVVSIIGWVLTGFCALFLAFDAVIHIVHIPAVEDAPKTLGFPDEYMPAIGVTELAGVALFA